MRKTVLYVIAFALASLGARLVLGHGGTFPPGPSSAPGQGPGGQYTGPADSTFNPGGSGGATGTSTGGATGGSDPDDSPGTVSGGGRPPTTPGGTGGGPARGPSTSALGRKARTEPSRDRWEVWWALNREAFLAGSSAADDASRQSASVADVAEGGTSTATDAADKAGLRPHRVSAEDVRARVQPTLLRLLREEHPILLDSAAIALGRSVSMPDSEDIVTELHRLLRSSYPSVRQSALISLGMLQHRSSIPILWGVMNDTHQGRQILGRSGAVGSVDRGIAALSLGYVGDPTLATILARQLRSDDIETAAGAVLGLGLLGTTSRHIVTQLLELLGDEDVDARVRAQVPITLGRLGEIAKSTTPSLTAALTDTRGNLDVRRSAAIALGRLASREDREVFDALRTVCLHERDGLLRHVSLLSLGHIGARSAETSDPSRGSGDDEPARTMRGLAQFLMSQLNDPARSQDRAWAALSAGVFGRALHPSDLIRHEFAGGLRRWLQRSNNPSDEAAAAIALGLLRDDSAGELILDRFRSHRDAGTRAHLAIALALLRERRAEAELTKALIEQRDPSLRVAAATALARIGDTDAAGKLVDMLADTPTFAATAATARALGRIGDRRHLAALSDIVEDAGQPEVVRGFACVALGMIAEKTELPWNAPLAIDANFAVPLSAQSELLDIY